MSSRDKIPGELHVPPAIWDDPKARELLRAWAASGDLHVSFRTWWENPDHWGVFLVDLARHAARAMANDGTCSEASALAHIREAFDKEWERSTCEGVTELIRKQ